MKKLFWLLPVLLLWVSRVYVISEIDEDNGGYFRKITHIPSPPPFPQPKELSKRTLLHQARIATKASERTAIESGLSADDKQNLREILDLWQSHLDANEEIEGNDVGLLVWLSLPHGSEAKAFVDQNLDPILDKIVEYNEDIEKLRKIMIELQMMSSTRDEIAAFIAEIRSRISA